MGSFTRIVTHVLAGSVTLDGSCGGGVCVVTGPCGSAGGAPGSAAGGGAPGSAAAGPEGSNLRQPPGLVFCAIAAPKEQASKHPRTNFCRDFFITFWLLKQTI